MEKKKEKGNKKCVFSLRARKQKKKSNKTLCIDHGIWKAVEN